MSHCPLASGICRLPFQCCPHHKRPKQETKTRVKSITLEYLLKSRHPFTVPPTPLRQETHLDKRRDKDKEKVRQGRPDMTRTRHLRCTRPRHRNADFFPKGQHPDKDKHKTQRQKQRQDQKTRPKDKTKRDKSALTTAKTRPKHKIRREKTRQIQN